MGGAAFLPEAISISPETKVIAGNHPGPNCDDYQPYLRIIPWREDATNTRWASSKLNAALVSISGNGAISHTATASLIAPATIAKTQPGDDISKNAASQEW